MGIQIRISQLLAHLQQSASRLQSIVHSVPHTRTTVVNEETPPAAPHPALVTTPANMSSPQPRRSSRLAARSLSRPVTVVMAAQEDTQTALPPAVSDATDECFPYTSLCESFRDSSYLCESTLTRYLPEVHGKASVDNEHTTSLDEATPTRPQKTLADLYNVTGRTTLHSMLMSADVPHVHEFLFTTYGLSDLLPSFSMNHTTGITEQDADDALPALSQQQVGDLVQRYSALHAALHRRDASGDTPVALAVWAGRGDVFTYLQRLYAAVCDRIRQTDAEPQAGGEVDLSYSLALTQAQVGANAELDVEEQDSGHEHAWEPSPAERHVLLPPLVDMRERDLEQHTLLMLAVMRMRGGEATHAGLRRTSGQESVQHGVVIDATRGGARGLPVDGGVRAGDSCDGVLAAPTSDDKLYQREEMVRLLLSLIVSHSQDVHEETCPVGRGLCDTGGMHVDLRACAGGNYTANSDVCSLQCLQMQFRFVCDHLAARDVYGMTALMHGCVSQCRGAVEAMLEVLQCLREKVRKFEETRKYEETRELSVSEGNLEESDCVYDVMNRYTANVMNVRDIDGNSVAFYACFSGLEDVLPVLLNAGCDINVRNRRNENLLHFCITHRLNTAVSTLIYTSIDVNAQNTSGNTPLMLAIINGEVDYIDQLLNAGVNLNLKNNQENNPLLYSCLDGDNATVMKLLDRSADILQTNRSGDIPLVLAAEACDSKTVQRLIDMKSPVNWTNKKGVTALMLASTNRFSTQNLKLLLAANANVNAQSEYGDTALIVAVKRNRKHNAKVLLKHRADVSMHDFVDEETNKHPPRTCNDTGTGVREDSVCSSSSSSSSSASASSSVSPSSPTLPVRKPKMTALMYAVAKGNHELVQLLLAEGVRFFAEEGGMEKDKSEASVAEELMRKRAREEGNDDEDGIVERKNKKKSEHFFE